MSLDRTCCANYKKPGSGKYSHEYVKCTHPGTHFQFTYDGETISITCGIHKNHFGWQLFHFEELTNQERAALVEVLKERVLECKAEVREFIAKGTRAEQKLASLESFNAVVARERPQKVSKN